MTNKIDRSVRNETFYMATWMEEEAIEEKLVEKGFNMDYTTWVYSWTIPAWVIGDNRVAVEARLEASNYHGYLINVKQETPK